MSRSHLKIAAALVGLVLLVVGVSGGLAERRLRASELKQIAHSLEQKAQLVRELVGVIPFDPENVAALDSIADRAESAAGARVTLIDRSGVVVGDSNVPLSKLPLGDNHADRPEVRAATAGQVGTSTRRSETVGRDLFYLAIPATSSRGGVVRLAIDLSDRDAVISEFRRALILAGGVGLCSALAFSFVLSWLSLRPLREMRRVADAIAGGDLDSRLTLRPIEELGGISAAINQMAAQIRQRVDDLTREKEQLQAVLNGMVEGVLVLDNTGRVMLANARLREFYDIDGEVVGRSVLEVVRDSEVDALVAEASVTDETVTRLVERIGADHRSFWVHAIRFPAKAGPRSGTVAVFRDVTETIRLESVRRDFVANASHELRTPVAAIRGFAETLRCAEGLSETDRESYLEIIDRHATRLGNLVSDLLELSKIEGGESPSQIEYVDLGRIAETLVSDSRELFEARGLEIALDVDAPVMAWARAEDVERVLTNLVGNAANYTDPGGRIAITIEADSGSVRMRVADTGIGISKADQERIFERFYRVDATRSRAVGGTGLGLAIVKHLVAKMGGEIAVESALDRGTTFTVTLPASTPQPA